MPPRGARRHAPGRLWDTGRGYPAARFDPDADEVRGLVVVLAPGREEEAVRALDEIEGEGVLYGRHLVSKRQVERLGEVLPTEKA